MAPREIGDRFDMNAHRHVLARDLFLQAISVPRSERTAFVGRQCSGDHALRIEVEKLLVYHDQDELALTAAPEPATLALPQNGGSPGPSGSVETVVAISTPPAPGKNDGDSIGPGVILAGRYRTEALLGKGGMGAVYRAHDLVLEQPVAIKFLDSAFARRPDWIERFRNEVRMARMVTHPNVCRAFDIGEANGLLFLSMEFIEGQDLAGLLRKTGRLTLDEAIDIARQVCTGLAAAHGAGVLHRDLKPANIMINAQGQVRLTDFGIAVAAQGKGRDVRAGTPAYMAPEQIAGRGVDARSDIYSLGLVLYELFSGEPAFQADSVDDYQKLHESAEPRALSAVAPDLEPGLEQLVHWCLRKDPDERPQSALSVAAALPGVDVLAVALSAEQMPAPELVAGASGARVSATVANWLLASVIAACLALPWARGFSGLAWDQPGTQPVEALAQTARGLAAARGGQMPAHEAFGFCAGDMALDEPRAVVPNDAQVPGPGGRELLFWFRTAPHLLLPNSGETLMFGNSRVSLVDPPITDPLEQVILLDPTGREIGRAAPGSPPAAREEARSPKIAQTSIRLLSLVLLAMCMPIAWRNHNSARGDRLGALKASLFVFSIQMAAWTIGAQHATEFNPELTLLSMAVLRSLAFAAVVMVLYLALEPLSRRYWPHMLIGWTRLVRFGLSDGVVWRHILVGLALGCFWALVFSADWAAARFLGWTRNEAYLIDQAADRLVGGRAAVAAGLMAVTFGLTQGILFATPLGLVRSVVRSPVLAAVLAGIALMPILLTRGAHIATSLVIIGAGVSALGLWVMVRYGLLVIVVASATAMLLNSTPLPWTARKGFVDQGLVVLLLICGLAAVSWKRGARPPRQKAGGTHQGT